MLIPHEPRLVVQTRGPLVVRDIEQLREFRSVRANLTIPTDSEDVRRAFEPKAPPLDRRWAAAEQLKAAGVPVGLCVTPTLPILDPDACAEQLAAVAPAVLVTQDFHDAGGRFGADTGDAARALLARTGWSADHFVGFADTLRALPCV